MRLPFVPTTMPAGHPRRPLRPARLTVLVLAVTALGACGERDAARADATTTGAAATAGSGDTGPGRLPAGQRPPGAADGGGTGASPGSTPALARVTVGDVDLTGIGYDVGRPDAPIVVVELSDFGCPYCASFALETEPELLREFVSSGRVYWKYVPFVIGMFPNGDAAAHASECAADAGRFWAARDSIYAGQAEWKRATDPVPVLRRLVESAGVSGDGFERCLAAEATRARTRRASAAATRLGVRATPTFFINGRMVEGALPLNVFRGGLRQMLSELEPAGND